MWPPNIKYNPPGVKCIKLLAEVYKKSTWHCNDAWLAKILTKIVL